MKNYYFLLRARKWLNIDLVYYPKNNRYYLPFENKLENLYVCDYDKTKMKYFKSFFSNKRFLVICYENLKPFYIPTYRILFSKKYNSVGRIVFYSNKDLSGYKKFIKPAREVIKNGEYLPFRNFYKSNLAYKQYQKIISDLGKS